MKTLQQYWKEITEKYVPLFNIPCNYLFEVDDQTIAKMPVEEYLNTSIIRLSEYEKVFMSNKYPGICLCIDNNPKKENSYTFFHYASRYPLCIEIDVPSLIELNPLNGEGFALFAQDEYDRWGYDFLKSIEYNKGFYSVSFNYHGAFTIESGGKEIYSTLTGNKAITREEYLEYLKTITRG